MIEELRATLRLDDDAMWHRVAAWLLAAVSGTWPFPILALSGDAGSAKSTVARRIRDLVDPQDGDLPGLSRDEASLTALAASRHVVAFDNVSGLDRWQADRLCRLATGGATVERRFYAQGVAITHSAIRPVLFTSTGDWLGRGDLLERTYMVRMPPRIATSARKTERTLNLRWAALRPKALGVLFDAVAHGLAGDGSVEAGDLTRMADACQLAAAAAPVLGIASDDMRASLLGAERDAAADAVASDCQVAAIGSTAIAANGSMQSSDDVRPCRRGQTADATAFAPRRPTAMQAMHGGGVGRP